MRGDTAEKRHFYDDAMEEIEKAINLAPGEADPYFYRGIIKSKLNEQFWALWDFKRCLDINPEHFEAKRNLRIVKSLFVREKSLRIGSMIGSFLLAVISIAQLVYLWRLYLDGKKISENMLIVMIPILLGLFVLSFLLPGLIKLKLPGLEAELSQTKQQETTSSGPKGEIGFGSSSGGATGGGPR